MRAGGLRREVIDREVGFWTKDIGRVEWSVVVVI